MCFLDFFLLLLRFTLRGFGVKRIFLYLDILLGVGYSDKARNATRTIYFSIGIAVEENHAKTKKNPPTKPSRMLVKSKKKASHFDKGLCI